MKEVLTITRLSELSGIPNSTCRRYLNVFEAFFLLKGGSRLKRYEPHSVEILKRIKHLYDEGRDTQEIYYILQGEFPMVIDGEEQRKREQTSVVTTLATSEDVEEIKKALEEQREFNKMLLSRLDQQQEYIRESIDRRDRELTQAIRESQRARLDVTTAEQGETKSFWERLFGK